MRKKSKHGGRRPGAGRPKTKKPRPETEGIDELARLGVDGDVIAMVLGKDLSDPAARRNFEARVQRGHAALQADISRILKAQAKAGRVGAARALAGAWLPRFQDLPEEVDEAGLVERVQAEIEKAKSDRALAIESSSDPELLALWERFKTVDAERARLDLEIEKRRASQIGEQT